VDRGRTEWTDPVLALPPVLHQTRHRRCLKRALLSSSGILLSTETHAHLAHISQYVGREWAAKAKGEQRKRKPIALLHPKTEGRIVILSGNEQQQQ
jgi:hypothetical protein